MAYQAMFRRRIRQVWSVMWTRLEGNDTSNDIVIVYRTMDMWKIFNLKMHRLIGIVEREIIAVWNVVFVLFIG